MKAGSTAVDVLYVSNPCLVVCREVRSPNKWEGRAL